MNKPFRFFVRVVITSAVLGTFANESSSYSQVSTITDRIRNDLITQNVNDGEITNILSELKQDGSWDDIDYGNTFRTSWDPSRHSRRLVQVCQAYNKPESIYFPKPEVKNRILSIIDYYVDRRPVSDNWWYNAKGVPTNLGPALVLMKTGANKIWLLSSSIDKACVKNNEEVLKENFRLAFEEAEIMPCRMEGIKIDGSFYQHGIQKYCAGYGMSFMSDISYIAELAAGTEYRMTDARMKVISAWIGHGNNPSDASYEYIIVPGIDLSGFNRWQKKNPFKKILNTPDLQALYNKNGNIFGLAFFKPGIAGLVGGLWIEAENPCLILVQLTDKPSYRITVSDPTATLQSVIFTIYGEMKGEGAAVNNDKTTTISFPLPQGDEAGRSVTCEYFPGEKKLSHYEFKRKGFKGIQKKGWFSRQDSSPVRSLQAAYRVIRQKAGD